MQDIAIQRGFKACNHFLDKSIKLVIVGWIWRVRFNTSTDKAQVNSTLPQPILMF